MQPHAMAVVAVGVARRLERGDGALAIAHPLANQGEREPGRGEARRVFHHLFKNVDGGVRLAAIEIVQGPAIAAVGDQIARGDEQRRNHATTSVRPGSAHRTAVRRAYPREALRPSPRQNCLELSNSSHI
jgi:hypothetical protein